jgi:hypothetical protein
VDRDALQSETGRWFTQPLKYLQRLIPLKDLDTFRGLDVLKWFRIITFDSTKEQQRGVALGCSRKYVSLMNGYPSMILSFSYFTEVIEEAGDTNTPPGYWGYIEYQLQRLETRLEGLHRRRGKICISSGDRKNRNGMMLLQTKVSIRSGNMSEDDGSRGLLPCCTASAPNPPPPYCQFLFSRASFDLLRFIEAPRTIHSK